MDLVFEERVSDSPYIETITQGCTTGSGTVIRPAEIHWHMVFTRFNGVMHPIVVGPLKSSGRVTFDEGAEILWIKLKLGAFMPHLPLRTYLDIETTLPDASSRSFWLNGASWQVPTYENVETFIDRLVRQDVLVRDTLIRDALQDDLDPMPSRTLRHRFLRATGLTQTHIRQFERAQRAYALLQQGVSILDVVFHAGYFDQPHLTRALKHWIGYTPAQIVRMSRPIEDCRFVQDNLLVPEYDTYVLET